MAYCSDNRWAGVDSEFVVKVLDELNHLTFDKINRIDGVLCTDTALYLNYTKRQYDLGTVLDYNL